MNPFWNKLIIALLVTGALTVFIINNLNVTALVLFVFLIPVYWITDIVTWMMDKPKTKGKT